VIAIDGPAGSGKSTVARAVAERLGLAYLDTGAMYRAVAFAAIRAGIDPGDAAPVADVARAMDLTIDGAVIVDGVDATIEIRNPEVTRAVSTVAANPEVRAELVLRQREWLASHGAAVVEGRDIGTVVFPAAAVKVYLTADDRERASRRSKEMLDLHYDQVAADMARRDRVDSTRPASPLTIAADAVRIDTTGRSVEAVVDQVIGLAQAEGTWARPSSPPSSPSGHLGPSGPLRS
jgi:cytidylate kinase